MFDFLYNITLQEDIKTGSVIPSIIVILVATVLEVAFVAILIKMLFF